MSQDNIDKLRREKRARLNSFFNQLKHGQDILRTKIEDIQARLAAIEDFLAEEYDGSQGGSEDVESEHGTQREFDCDNNSSSSQHHGSRGFIE